MTLGEPYEWDLPDIEEGSYALSEVIVEPDSAIKQSISFTTSQNRLHFDGSENLQIDKLYLIKVTLVNSRGDKVPCFQSVYVIGREKEEELNEEVGETDAEEAEEAKEVELIY